LKSTFPSKILLAGEYTVLLGSDAIAIPYDYYSGGWRAGIRSDYPFDIKAWIEHLSSIEEVSSQLDINRMHMDYLNDLRFVSNIPQGGGLGSSGGVTAAFYDRYIYNELSIETQLEDIRAILSEMESYFHGESSGVDPLVSLTGRGYVIRDKEGELLEPEIPQSISLHLILTTTIRNTAPLITFFMESMEKSKFRQRIEEEQMPAVKNFVSAWLEGRVSDVEKSFQAISSIEYDLMKPMITKDIKKLWKQGLDDENFSIKLCGAGGGGAYLACGELPEDLPFKHLKIS